MSDNIITDADEVATAIEKLLEERRHIATVLREFYLAPLSVVSVGPVLQLAEDLNPGLAQDMDEIAAARARATLLQATPVKGKH